MTAQHGAAGGPDRTSGGPRPPSAAAEEHLARRRAIGAWCDRHLAAMHTLSSLILDDPSITRSGLGELLDEPRGAREPSSPREPGHDRAAHASPHSGPDTRAARTVHAVRADRCPDGIRPDDRVELALRLMGDRTSAAISRALHVPEEAVTARLRRGLWILFSPCGSTRAPGPAHR
jgi:DNA-directed RNA polymerase specialized sigma24 family protein